jgi:hypothetical protein
MPDKVQILEAMAAAALLAAAVFLIFGWPWRPRVAAGSADSAPARGTARAYAGSVLGLAVGFSVGCWWLGLLPHWPPVEDRDRLLLILLPAAVGVELVAAFSGRFRWSAWILRLAVAAAAAPLLLHNSIYISDAAGPGSREWTPEQTWRNLGGLAAALMLVWVALAWLASRTSAQGTATPSGGERRMRELSVLLAVALTCAAAGVTVMYSGYASGGQLGLPLAGALAGVAIASLVLSRPPDVNGVLGPGLVGLFALLVVGHFFGVLTGRNAALLFFAPLLCWLPELPAVRSLRPWALGFLRVVLTAVPVAVAVSLAQQKFVEDSARTAPGPGEVTAEDYMNYGK